MGMFDNILVHVNILPLDSNHKDLVEKKCGPFQTKSLTSVMDNYMISKSGEFWLETVTSHYAPVENTDGIQELVGCIKTISTGWEMHNYTGKLNFYTYYTEFDKNKWYEFDASFINGKLQRIVAVDIPGKFIDEEILNVFT